MVVLLMLIGLPVALVVLALLVFLHTRGKE